MVTTTQCDRMPKKYTSWVVSSSKQQFRIRGMWCHIPKIY